MVVLLETPLLRWLGRISYALYLVQQPFCFPDQENSLSAFPVNIFASLLVASGMHYLVERPALRLRNTIVERGTLRETSR
jgi:peptidoglycan/LPS O-acetylase OafA/YrhL